MAFYVSLATYWKLLLKKKSNYKTYVGLVKRLLLLLLKVIMKS